MRRPEPEMEPLGSSRALLVALRELGEEGPLELKLSGRCMVPLAEHGSRVQVRAARRYWPGDVLVFRGSDGRFFAHRLLGYFVRRRQVHIVSQGDNMRFPDSPVPVDQIVGRIVGGECSRRLAAVPWTDRCRALGRFFRIGLEQLVRR